MPRKNQTIKVTQKPTSNKDKSTKTPKKVKEDTISTTNKIHTKDGDFATDEASRLLSVFPEEIWLLVLAKLKNTEDVTTTYNSSLFFRNLLLPQRVSFLFPQVWKVLGKKYEDEEEYDPVYYQGRQISQLRHYLTPNGELYQFRLHSVALKLRKVCRNWCNGIDQFYRNLDCSARRNQGNLRTSWNGRLEQVQEVIWEKCYAFFTRQDILNFRNHFDQTHLVENERSPFLTNEICIRLNDSKEYTMRLKRLLEEYNQHIWHCNMIIKRGQRSLSDIYLEMRNILELLPKLIGLKVWFEGSTRGKLNQKVPFENPLPILSKLVYMKAEKLPADIFAQLIARNLHIKIIEMSKGQTVGRNIWTAEIPTLSELSIDIRSNPEFEKLRDLAWKPAKISLNFDKCPYIPWSKIFKLVESKWGQTTVTELMLGLPSSRTKAEILEHIRDHESLRLNLPNVKRLRIELGKFSGVDFILPMKDTLRQLDVAEAYLIEASSNSVISKTWDSSKFRQTIFHTSVIKLFDYDYDSDSEDENSEDEDSEDEDFEDGNSEDEYDVDERAENNDKKEVGKKNICECNICIPVKKKDEDKNVYADNIWIPFPKLQILKLFEGRFKETQASEIYTRLEWLKLHKGKF